MKSVKFIMAVAVIVMLCVSCHKEGQFNPSKKVKKITTTVKQGGQIVEGESGYFEFVWDDFHLTSINVYNGGSIDRIETYSYDNKNRVSKIQSTTGNSLEYVYEGNLLKEIKSYQEDKHTYSFVVTHDGRSITEIQVQVVDDKGVFVPNEINPFFFLPNEVATTINKSIKKSFGQKSVQKTYAFSWENKNLTQMQIVEGRTVTTTKYEYDNKKNPLFGWFCTWDNSFSAMFVNHNVTREFGNTTVDGKEVGSGEFKYSYTYGGSYPVTKSWTEEDGSGNTFTHDLKFEY